MQPVHATWQLATVDVGDMFWKSVSSKQSDAKQTECYFNGPYIVKYVYIYIIFQYSFNIPYQTLSGFDFNIAFPEKNQRNRTVTSD